MPQIAAAVSAVAGAIGASGLGSFIFQQAIGFVVSTVISSVAAAFLRPTAQQKNARASQGTLINETGSLAPIPIVYGNVRIAPNRVYLSTSDNNDAAAGDEEYLHAVYTISNNHIEGMKGVYFNGEKVGEFTGPYSSGSYIDGYAYPENTPMNDVDGAGTMGSEINGFTIDSAYSNFVSDQYSITLTDDDIHINAYSGNPFQTFSQDLITSTNDPATVDEDFRGAGWSGEPTNSCSWIYVRLKYNEKLFSGGIPDLQLEVWGEPRIDEFVNPNDTTQTFKQKLLADIAVDPDLELTDNGDFSRIGAVQIIDYLIYKYGRDLDPNVDLDFDSFLEVAKIQVENSIFSDGVIDTNQTVMANLNQLLANNLCALVRTNGKYKLKYLAPEDTIFTGSTFTFDENNILGDWKVSVGDLTTDYDIARIEFYSKQADFQADSITVYKSTLDTTTNFNPVNQKAIMDLTLPFTTEKADAKYIGTVLMEMSKFDKVVSFKTTMEALQLEPYDPVYITHSLPGWTNERYLVKEIAINADSTVNVTLMEYPDIYPLTLAQENASLDNIPVPEISINDIVAFPSYSNLTNYTFTVGFSLEPTDVLVVVASSYGTTGRDIEYIDVDNVPITLHGTTIKESEYQTQYTRVASYTGATLASGNHNIVIGHNSTMYDCVCSVFKITGGNALYPVEFKSIHSANINSGTIGDNEVSLTIPDLPANHCFVWNTHTAQSGSYAQVTSITSPDGYTINEEFDMAVENSGRHGGFKPVEQIAYSNTAVDVDFSKDTYGHLVVAVFGTPT